jgi:hypothetical protein
MCLVDDDVLPSKLLQVRLLTKNHFVAGDADIELLVNESFLDELGTVILVAL